MTRILLTGGSGFIAAHVLDTLLERGHSVVTTVRSQEKGQRILDAHPQIGKDRLDFVVVEDISQPNAFERAVISEPPFEAVIHTASPFHFKTTDARKDLLAPAINGTSGILQAIKKNAPSVKRVVVTSSFAAIIDPTKPSSYVYSEADWNPIKEEEVDKNPTFGYRGSKTFAEKAAWDFIEKEKPGFTLATCNPPLVLGPVIHYLASLDAINTSNERISDLISGKGKDSCPPTGTSLWVDVRDVAMAHVLAAEKPEAANKRFFLVAGTYSNEEIVGIISEKFPELKDKLPSGDALIPGVVPKESRLGFDSSRSKEVLGLTYRPLTESVVDAVKSLQRHL
ncbi:NADPH-dependent methylglyoxal reductase GRE2 [Nannizzia gypsea CBS 118893]|uniref:NADPH-dependent methylglyoxal reductase GRE2 n=1 Tax=Arthroderma gypseum (strain ATCC MYA-4604 / CBS 118893) TaxID=535722 RepID=E5QYJ5_ARTGP|nr:NADPH-dependent methylglyoxal reductase GRE2 [Nannizzia gypsea CBS 118893]EFQ98071.1 NADPH-dependent methylglyoxal reductase GRE2 [Nannizzia gypsea CBS 118893]